MRPPRVYYSHARLTARYQKLRRVRTSKGYIRVLQREGANFPRRIRGTEITSDYLLLLVQSQARLRDCVILLSTFLEYRRFMIREGTIFSL